MNATGVSEFWLRDALFDDPHQLCPLIQDQCWTNPYPPPRIHRWREYVTNVGRIDLLLAWPGVVVVVECKKGCASEGAIAQVLRYVGALEGASEGTVIGVVAAEGFDNLAVSAARACNVGLVRLSPAVTCSDGFPEKTLIGEHEALKAAASWQLPSARSPGKHLVVRATSAPLPYYGFTKPALLADQISVKAINRHGRSSCAVD
jgi:hypothetical protein